MIAEILHKVANFERKSSPYRIRPSLASPEIEEIGYKGRCKRQMVYHCLNFPVDNINERMQTVFDDSSFHELLTYDLVRKTAFKLRDSQFKVNCGFFGFGSIDGILTDLLGVDYLWEHKAINHFSFLRLEKEELPIDYVVQCCIYILGLQEYLPTLDKAILLIKNKNTAQYLEFLIQYDKSKDIAVLIHKLSSIDQKKIALNIKLPNLLTRAKQKFEFVEQKAKENTLPKRDYTISDWQCQYCGYKNTCWQDYTTEFKQLGENVELNQALETQLDHLLELKMHIKEMEKEKETIEEMVKKTMKDNEARMATTPNYALILSLVKTQRIDKNKIADDILKQATIESISERLNIRKKNESKLKEVSNGTDRHNTN